MTEMNRFSEIAVAVAAAAILAALVHLVVVLVAPFVAARDSFSRLAALGALNQTVALSRAGPSEKLLPYADPAVATAFCRFDLALGPIRIRAPATRAFGSISFHTHRGLVFYALTDRAATHGLIDVVLGTPEEVRALAEHDDEEAPSHDLRVAAPAREGYVLARVFSEFPSLYPEAQAKAGQLTCVPESIPP